jgi:hypothetical protein
MLKILKKLVAKKPAKKTARKSKAAPVRKVPALKPIGRVTHYFAGIKVAIVKFSVPPKAGSSVRFHGATTDFVQIIKSVQYDHEAIIKIPKGKQVGIKVRSRVRDGDAVYPAKA